jgi:hypothetical protein
MWCELMWCETFWCETCALPTRGSGYAKASLVNRGVDGLPGDVGEVSELLRW